MAVKAGSELLILFLAAFTIRANKKILFRVGRSCGAFLIDPDQPTSLAVFTMAIIFAADG
jgi:hypothetical protein